MSLGNSCVIAAVATFAALGGALARSPLGQPAAVDFSAGWLSATGAGAPDMRAPSTSVARVTAARLARENLRSAALKAALSLRADGDRTVADALGCKDAACAGERGDRLRAVIDVELEEQDVRYFSDGAVVVRARLPLEAVRGVIDARAAVEVPGTGSGTPEVATALVVDAGKAKPVFGVAPLVIAGGMRLAAPVIYAATIAAARKDPRIGDAPVVLEASQADGANVVVGEKAEKQLKDARRSGAVVVIVGAREAGK